VTTILAVGLAWLLIATVVALVIGRAIRLADERSPHAADVDRFLSECFRDLQPMQASDGADRFSRTARRQPGEVSGGRRAVTAG
jgi:hypothetical protein